MLLILGIERLLFNQGNLRIAAGKDLFRDEALQAAVVVGESHRKLVAF